MRRARQQAAVSLFPFLSVLLCIMGVLAFMSVSFLLMNQPQLPASEPEIVEFEWVGAPAFVKPVFIRCLKDQIVYYDLFQSKDRSLSFRELIMEIQAKNGSLTRYFKRVVAENLRIKRSFGSSEHFPLLLIYPDGVLSAEMLMILIEQIDGLNAGLEPMLPNWEVPYQSQS
ncbi:MAG: hypothetical protein HQM13_17165 [SAR324 cluster bacterium]|nr:hypothetical protein [SAR324 cluster bacterium]